MAQQNALGVCEVEKETVIIFGSDESGVVREYRSYRVRIFRRESDIIAVALKAPKYESRGENMYKKYPKLVTICGREGAIIYTSSEDIIFNLL